MIQAFGIGCTLLLLIALAIAVYKGVPILVASPICGALCLLCNGMPVMEGMKEAYIGEAAAFFSARSSSARAPLQALRDSSLTSAAPEWPFLPLSSPAAC